MLCQHNVKCLLLVKWAVAGEIPWGHQEANHMGDFCGPSDLWPAAHAGGNITAYSGCNGATIANLISFKDCNIRSGNRQIKPKL